MVSLLLIRGRVNKAGVSDQAAEAIDADSFHKLTDCLGRRLARRGSDPVLAGINFPQHLDLFGEGSSNADVVERHCQRFDAGCEGCEALEL